MFTHLVKKFPAFYGTRRFITVFLKACQMHLVHSFPNYSLRSILILSSHLRLGLRFRFSNQNTVGLQILTNLAPLNGVLTEKVIIA